MEELLQFTNEYRVPAQHLIAILLAGAIWLRGGDPERWLIAAFLGTMVVPVWVLWWLGFGSAIDGTVMLVRLLFDVAAAAIFVAIALRANRNYPLWIAAFQLVALGGAMVSLVPVGVSPLALVILVVGPSYCQLLLLLAGFVRHVRRERRFGPYRAWRIAPPAIGGLTA